MSQTAECRQCTKCLAMFFDQYSSKGTCPAGGSHQGGVYQFELPYGLPETPNGQFNWWVCDKCVSVFYNGYPDKGVCPGGGGHQNWPRFDFLLAYNVAATSASQDGWRYCGRCKGLFFNGEYANKGHCPAGGAHAAEGLLFTLPYFAGDEY